MTCSPKFTVKESSPEMNGTTTLSSSSANFNAPVAVDRARELTPVNASPADDELLLSDAFASPKVKNLSALDDMTPHARDYVSRPK